MPTHTSEGMTPVPQAATLSPQLLLSFGPVEATWRGLLLWDGHSRLHRLYRLPLSGLDELSRSECACRTVVAGCREPVIPKVVKAVKAVPKV